MTVNAIVEKGKGEQMPFSIHMDYDKADYSVYGTGNTVAEAKEDFLSAYQELKAYYQENNLKFKELSFIFKYDLASFLEYYAYALTLSGLENITGVNQRQLSHYINGVSHPRQKTVLKIEESIRAFGKDLSEISLSV